MKGSAVWWLGEVAQHWDVAALRHRYTQSLGKMLDTKTLTGTHAVPYLRNVDVQWDRINTKDLPLIDISPSEHERYTLRPGDLVVCEGGEVGRAAIWRGQIGVCGFQKALHRLRPYGPDHDSPRFLYYTLRVAVAAGAFDDGHESTIAHLTGDKLRAHRFPFPPAPEQTAIVRFLDDTDRRIRRYIRAKQKLINLLEEQKQAIIHRAVTRGLQRNIRLKPSGVKWLGEVPEHWEVRRVQGVFRERNETGRAELPILAVSIARGVTTGNEYDEDGRPKRLIEDRALYKVAHKGDITYNTMRMWQGAVGVVPLDGLVSPAYVVVEPRDSINAAFFALLFRTEACKGDTVSRSRGIVDDRNRLYWDAFKDLRVPVPPCDEQNAIVELISKQTKAVDVLVDRLRSEVALMTEYVTRLIADVVTGKLDVREEAARLPDQVKEPEPLAEAAVGADAEHAADDELDPESESAEA